MQKEFRQVLREKLSLRIIFLMPFIQLVILGYAITTDVKNVPSAMVDLDNSAFSREIADSLSSNSSFRYVGKLATETQAKQLMDNGYIKLAIVVPANFEKDLKNGRRPDLQLIIEGVNGNTAGIAGGYVAGVAVKLQQKWMAQAGVVPAASGSTSLITLQPRMLYNDSMESKNNIVPGIVSVLLTMITMFLTAINIVREKEIGTLEQLVLTPIKNRELIIGKILPFGVLGFALLNIGILAAGLIWGIWPLGSIWLLYFLSCLFMFTTLGMGMFISTFCSTQQQSMFFVWFFAIFCIILSGFFVPIENMPHWVQTIGLLNPLRYYMAVVRAIYLKGSGLSSLIPEFLAMVIYGVTILGFAIFRFQKRLR